MNFSPLEPNAGRPAAYLIVTKGDSSVQQMLQICHNNFGRLRLTRDYAQCPGHAVAGAAYTLLSVECMPKKTSSTTSPQHIVSMSMTRRVALSGHPIEGAPYVQYSLGVRSLSGAITLAIFSLGNARGS